MPHMVTVDYATGDLWLADTGLHQVIKMSPDGRILQELGRRLEPGHDDDHFCKPTHVRGSYRHSTSHALTNQDSEPAISKVVPICQA